MREKIKLVVSILVAMILFSCIDKPVKFSGKTTFSLATKNEDGLSENSTEIHQLLDSLNVAAAQADFTKYFSYFAEGATYNGTDATENWDKESFMAWAKPYFDAKTTWNFKTVKRNIYHFEKHTDIAWFDELLNTQMKICRGSGVVVKQNGKWKIQQYVLSMTIPNSQLDKVVKIKTAEEDSILDSLNKSRR
ncbi:MAG: nuclear transport factor 2 family protein [Bacteroidota bacterium]